MRVIAILGSRNKNGQTARATEAFLEGVEHEGIRTERIFLPPLQIERCRQCDDNGWGICRTKGECVIEDDFARIADMLRDARAVVFATPVYFSDLSESMRAFLDRLRRTCIHEKGKHGIIGKPAVGICVAGGGGGGANECSVSLERVLRTCGFIVTDIVPVRRQNLEMKENLLESAGRWLATSCPRETVTT